MDGKCDGYTSGLDGTEKRNRLVRPVGVESPTWKKSFVECLLSITLGFYTKKVITKANGDIGIQIQLKLLEFRDD